MMARTASLVALVTLAGLVAGCGSEPSRADVLAEVASTTIVPAYERFDSDAAALATASRQHCDGDGEGLRDTPIEALVAARSSWSYTEALWVGPVMERRSWAVIDWPIRADEIVELIADAGAEMTTDYLGNRIGADQRGLGAVEYVLASDADPLAGPDGERWCQYLVGISDLIAAEASELHAGWTDSWDGGPPYVEIFSDPESGDLDTIVNDSLFLLEAMTDLELGKALGVTGSDPDPEAIIEGPAGLGVADLSQHLAGLRAVLVGDGGGPAGLGPLLGEDLAERLADELDTAAAEVAAIDGPLQAAVVAQPDQVAAARDALQAVQVTVTTEVVSRLGVTVGFSDADGDSG